MTASEFAFMTLGLLLGVLSGAALIDVLRSRPPAPRQIRLTVTPDAIPRRRSATLAEDAFVLPGPEPAFGGPGDRRQVDRPLVAAAESRTDVRSPVAPPLPPVGAGDPTSSLPLSRMLGAPLLTGPGGPGFGGGAIAIPVVRETDWTLAALRSAAAQVAERAIHDQRLSAESILDAATARRGVATTAGADRASTAAPPRPVAEHDAGPPAAGTSSQTAAPDDVCGEVRRVADERCAVATRAAAQADTAREALRAAQRAYDDHHTRAEQASEAADPRGIRAAKEAAQQAFREARAAATTPDEVEAAARGWLTEINRINRSSREAAATIQREREAATGLHLTLERLTVEADAARISAEAAQAACIAAREAVADCQEAAEADRASTAWPPAPSVGPGHPLTGLADDESELEAAFSATGAGEPAILRLVRGDRAVLGRIVAELAGDDPAERRRWQLALADLVDSIVARAIESSALTFPLEHPFWGAFTLGQNRDIVAALSSLGYRFDGLGGWSDERTPSQRDLSLAVGYAGLDPMRIRPWPGEQEMAELFREVSVAADEYLAGAAGGLTLGELVSALGPRAEGLADLWNDWGRVRPLLLAGG